MGAAIVLLVNVVILPISSEKELRRTLVASLHHCATFGHLISKSYTLDLADEERIARDSLIATIRADFVALDAKLKETGYEVRCALTPCKQS
jgi:hypothetical protein